VVSRIWGMTHCGFKNLGDDPLWFQEFSSVRGSLPDPSPRTLDCSGTGPIVVRWVLGVWGRVAGAGWRGVGRPGQVVGAGAGAGLGRGSGR
jgi:hypothetical protein